MNVRMKKLIENWPREIGIPYRKMIRNKNEFWENINLFNGLKTIYYSLYNCNEEGSYENCLIDKLWFDMDNDNSLKCILNFHKKLKNLKHLLIFSGRGFHVYIFTKGYEFIKNKKDCLYNAQLNMLKFIGLKEKIDIDERPLGDIARIVRVPNTQHIETKKFCITLTEEDLEKGLDWIKEKAKKPCYEFTYYGNELFDISKFDIERTEKIEMIKIPENVKIEIDRNSLLKNIPVCISNMMIKDYVDWDSRYHIISYFRDRGYIIQETNEILIKYLKGKIKHGHDNYEHCILTEKQLQYLYKRPELFFSCDRIKKDGHCIEGCKMKNGGVYI